MISISVIEDKFLRRNDDSSSVMYPVQNEEFVYFKFEDGTRLVFRKYNDYWHAEIEHIENTSAYTIERKANFNSDIFTTNSAMIEETIFSLREEDE